MFCSGPRLSCHHEVKKTNKCNIKKANWALTPPSPAPLTHSPSLKAKAGITDHAGLIPGEAAQLCNVRLFSLDF